MRLSRIAFLGVFSLCVGVGAACGSSGSPTLTGASSSSGAGATTAASTTQAASTTSTTGGTGGMTLMDAGTDGPDIGEPSTTYPAPHAAPPQVVTYGGPVLASPKFVPVFFSNDDPTFVSQLEDFVSKVGGTAYWTAAVSEYGVGPGTGLAPIELAEAAPATIDDTAIQTWLQGKLTAAGTVFPASDPNTVYVLHYPESTTITLQGSSSCNSFGGYHSNFQLGSANVAYAVVPRCSSFGALMGIDAVTGAESHELAEAATDPYPESDVPAYATIDDGHIYWERVLGGGEVGDMCAQFPQAFTKFPELDYTVQRIWSNKAAKAGHDPCQPPFPGEPAYYNAAPNLTDTIHTTFQGQMISVKGVEIALGDTKTIDLDLFSDGAVGPWTVEALDLSSAFNPNAPVELETSLDATQGENGQKLHLTLTVKAAGHRGTETFLLVSKLNGNENWWIGIVGTPVDAGAPTGSSSGGFTSSTTGAASSSAGTSGTGGASSGTGGTGGA